MFENPLLVIEHKTYTLKHTPSETMSLANTICAKHVCMFENHLPVMEHETYTLNYTHSNFIEQSKQASLKRLVSMYVCMHVCMLDNLLNAMGN